LLSSSLSIVLTLSTLITSAGGAAVAQSSRAGTGITLT
jgi:hypothetical protein